MSYLFTPHSGSKEYRCNSFRVVGECDACNTKKLLLQVLPAENNAGEFFAAKLCRACLLRLADELHEPYTGGETFSDR